MVAAAFIFILVVSTFFTIICQRISFRNSFATFALYGKLAIDLLRLLQVFSFNFSFTDLAIVYIIF